MPTVTFKFKVSPTTGQSYYQVRASSGKSVRQDANAYPTVAETERAGLSKLISTMGWADMDLIWHRGVLPCGDVVYVGTFAEENGKRTVWRSVDGRMVPVYTFCSTMKVES